ncbi:MAG: hypothetical protein R3F19_22685 [Verrucomicrobiales bacterium]
MLKYLGGWALGLLATVGVMRLIGPTTGEGPEAIVVRALGNEYASATDEEKKGKRAGLVAAYDELALKGTPVTDEELSRFFASVRELYAADPEAFWMAFDKWTARLSLKRAMGFLVGFSGYPDGNVGAVVAMDFLERGYVKAGSEDPGTMNALIEQAANEDPERCVRWLEKQNGGDLDHYVLMMAPRLFNSVPAHLHDRLTKVVEESIALTIAGGERLDRATVRGIISARSGQLRSNPFADRLLEALIPALPTAELDDRSWRWMLEDFGRMEPLDDALQRLVSAENQSTREVLFASVASDPELRHQAMQLGIPITEAQRRDYAERDLLEMISEQIDSDNFGNELAGQLSQMADDMPMKGTITSILNNSDDLNATLAQLNQLPGEWRSRIMTDVVGLWASRDVVTASQALSQLESVPDKAIAKLVSEIAGDQEAASLWANQIQDSVLRDQTLQSVSEGGRR